VNINATRFEIGRGNVWKPYCVYLIKKIYSPPCSARGRLTLFTPEWAGTYDAKTRISELVRVWHDPFSVFNKRSRIDSHEVGFKPCLSRDVNKRFEMSRQRCMNSVSKNWSTQSFKINSHRFRFALLFVQRDPRAQW